jgi:hypothetical protein
MRVLAPFLAVLASGLTILATTVRLWWSKPRPQPEGVQDLPPKAPSWLQRLATAWLVVFIFGGTAILLIVVVYSLISLSA